MNDLPALNILNKSAYLVQLKEGTCLGFSGDSSVLKNYFNAPKMKSSALIGGLMEHTDSNPVLSSFVKMNSPCESCVVTVGSKCADTCTLDLRLAYANPNTLNMDFDKYHQAFSDYMIMTTLKKPALGSLCERPIKFFREEK